MVERFTDSNIMWNMDGVPLVHDESGAWVRFSDRAAELASLRTRAEAAESKLAGLPRQPSVHTRA